MTKIFIHDADSHSIGKRTSVNLQILMQMKGVAPIELRVLPFMLAKYDGREVDTTYLLLRVPFILNHCLAPYIITACGIISKSWIDVIRASDDIRISGILLSVYLVSLLLFT